MSVLAPSAAGNPLTARSASEFERRGVLFPLTVMAPGEAAALRQHLAGLGKGRDGELPPAFNLKPHLLIPRLWALVHDRRVLDPVAAILGHDLLCWGSSFFDKPPGSARHVHWHQDATYWGLDRPDAVTAWIALTPSHGGNGCLRVVPGSHRHGLAHVHSPDPDNMLPGRERLADPVEEAEALDVVLEPGEMSLHHLLLVHGSRPNLSQQRRIGFAIRYIAGDLRQRGALRGSATLVRGRDHGGFDLEREPEGNLDPAAVRRHAEILRRGAAIVKEEIRLSRAEGSAAP